MSPIPDRPRAATLADIARELGVSTATVSRALQDHPDVRLSTREAVKHAAARLNYRISPTARALRTGRHESVSFVVPLDLIGWWEPLLRGAGREAASRGYRLVLNPVDGADSAPSNASPTLGEDLTKFIERSGAQPIDGFIVVTPGDGGWKAAAAARGLPLVIIDDLRPHPGFHVWASENYQGAREGVEHLIADGRRHIVAIAPREALPGDALTDRLRGYADAVREAGLPEHIVDTDETYPPTRTTSDSIDELLATNADFDAVFVPVDFVAFAVMRSLRRAGLSVPGDVAVLGFDGDPAAVALDPPLSTVAQPFAEIGAAAVGTLIDLVEGRGEPPRDHRLPTTFIERGST